jgi:predicted AAA+ superfamily ATPase
VRRPQALRAWLAAYAAATATTASYNRIMEAATPGQSDKPSRSTATVYRDVLAQLWLLDPVDAWAPTRNRIERLSQSPKHFLADPGLAARILGVGPGALLGGGRQDTAPNLREGTLLGALFEHLAALSLRVYAEAAGARLGHLRTRGGDHEVDFIVEAEDGRVVAFEVKLAHTATTQDVRHLDWLVGQTGDNLADRCVLTTGRHAYRRPDGVAVIPLALLGP